MSAETIVRARVAALETELAAMVERYVADLTGTAPNPAGSRTQARLHEARDILALIRTESNHEIEGAK